MDKTRFTEYELDTETKPMKLTIIETQEDRDDAQKAIDEFQEHMLKLTEEGKKIKEEEDAKLKDKLIELENAPTTTGKKTPEEIARRDYILKVRTIALSKLGINALIHTSDLTEKQHKEFIKKCDKILNKMSEDEITTRFNEIVIDEIFNSKSDYTKYPIYQY